MRIAQNKQRILYILPIFTEDSAQQIRYKTSAEKGRYSGYIFDSADKAADIAYAKNIILIYGVRTNSHLYLHKMLLNRR